MTRHPKHPPRYWTIAAYACICVALLAVVLLGIWGAYRDITLVRSTALQAEIAQLRSEGIRIAARIERHLDETESADPATLLQQPWLRDYWQRSVAEGEPRLYGAVVDASGTIVMHSNPEHVGERLGRRWYESVIRSNGGDLFETQSASLTGGQRTYDIRIPITHQGREIGEYHTGFDLAWFDRWVADQRREILGRWTWIVGAILLIVFLAAISLYYLALRSLALTKAAQLAELQREAEVGQLAAGLAHEICNPLHALRLNLHALGRAHNGKVALSREEITAITHESNEEIDRVDRLMRELVGFASPQKPRIERLDLSAEVRATLDFVQQEMQQKGIHVQTEFPAEPACVMLDRSRLRQVLLNLLGNAREAVNEGGAIEVRVARRNLRVEISVADDGPGVPERDRQRIFDPFYSTKESGSGLGLALVRRFVTEAGGTVAYENRRPQGARFVLRFPAAFGSRRITRQKVA